jgi:hypothetical protein
VSFALAAACLLLVLANAVSAADVPLAWDPNSEADLAGYGIYYQKNAPGPPYILFGYVTLAELADANNPKITVTGLDAGAQYYFAATAFDTANNESDFSTSVCAKIDNASVVIPCPTGNGGGGGSSGGGSSGGGGGGGCFISATAGEHESLAFGVVGPSLWGLLVLLWSVLLRNE